MRIYWKHFGHVLVKNHGGMATVCFFTWVLLTSSVFAQTDKLAPVDPLWRAHAHNDYERDRPLLEALERGIGSVEVDIHLVDGALLVAHDLDEVKDGQTLERLYLDPLRAHIRANEGKVYEQPGTLVLLIDVKSEAEVTYKALRNVLSSYNDILTRFEGDTIEEGPVMAIISGNRARDMMLKESVRWAAYDGRLEDLGQSPAPSVAFMPLISSNWMHVARWYGYGTFSEASKKKLTELVTKTHKEGRKLRFWATSDNHRVWDVLYEAGVDYLNADDLASVQTFLQKKLD